MSAWNLAVYLGVLVTSFEVTLSQEGMSASCPPEKFLCDGERCIPWRWQCDGAFDCRDHSDEDNCDRRTCKTKYSRCCDGQCVPESWWCDGQVDCLDSSDEVGCGQSSSASTTLATKQTSTQPSAQTSNQTPTQPSAQTSNQTSTQPSVQTSTQTSTQPSAQTSTQAASTGDLVVFMTATTKRWYNLSVKTGTTFANATTMEVDKSVVSKVTSFDVHVSRRRLCWVDENWKTVMCGNVTEAMEVTNYRIMDSPSTGALFPKGVAIDWTNNNVYWTDHKKGTVRMGSLAGKDRGRKTIIQELIQPSDITLDPRNGWLFICADNVRVVRYQLDGTDRKVVVEGGIHYMRRLTIDFTLDRLFWLDSRNKSVSSCRQDGTDRLRHFSLKWRPYTGIAVLTDTARNQTSVYLVEGWSDIVRIYSLGSGNVTTLQTLNYPSFQDIKVFKEKAQPTSVSHCQDDACSHLCLPQSSDHGRPYQCSCPDNFISDSSQQICRYDGIYKQASHGPCSSGRFQCKSGWKKCVGMKSVCNGRENCADASDEGPRCSGSTLYLLTAEGNKITKTFLADNSFNSSSLWAYNGSTKNVRSVDVDIRRGQVFFAVQNAILRADITDSMTVQKVTTVAESVDIVDLSVDWLHGLVYWVDGYHKTVYVSTGDGSFTTQLFTEGGPRVIAVDPIRGWLYLGDKSHNSRAKLLKVGMDGKSSSEVMNHLGYIGSIAIDFESEYVCWTDHIIKALMGLPLSGRGPLLVYRDPQQGTMSGLSIYQITHSCRSVNSFDGCEDNITDPQTVTWSSQVYEYTVFDDQREITTLGRKVYRKGNNIHWVYVTDHNKKTVRKFSKKNKIWNDVRVNADSPTDSAVFDISSQPMAWTRCWRKNGGCSHVCIPTPTDKICMCPPPLALYGSWCGYKDMLLINTKKILTQVEVESKYYEFFDSKEEKFPVVDIDLNSHVASIDVDVRNNAILWTDSNLGGIYMTRFKVNLGLGSCEKIFSRGVVQPEGLAVDWIHENVYWSDSNRHTISVGSLQTRNHMTLIDSHLGVVKGIAVHPGTRWLYWTNWGDQMYSKVERCRLDGSHRQDVIATGLYTPNGLAIDYEEDRLFVGDAGSDVIMSCSMTGTECYTLPISGRQGELVSIALYRDFVYWLDKTSRNVRRMKKDTGKDKNSILYFITNTPLGTVVFHPDRQPVVPSACGTDNGGCLLCLPTPGNSSVPLSNDNFRCGCPDDKTTCSRPSGCKQGYRKHQNTCVRVNECDRNTVCSHICHNKPDGVSCSCPQGYDLVNETGCRLQGPSPQLLIVDGRHLRLVNRFELPEPRIVKVVPPQTARDEKGMGRPIAVDIDVDGHRIFWADRNLKAIKTAQLRGNVISSPSVLVDTGVKYPEGVAYDWIHEAVYWVNSGLNDIRVVTLPAKFIRTIHSGLDRPRAIAVDPAQGCMYWTTWGGSPSVERSGMDGSGRKVIINTNIVWPNGLTIDYSERRLYWTDGAMGVISSSDMDGRHRRAVFFNHNQQAQLMYSVAVIEDYVYWMDWKRRYVRGISKKRGHLRTLKMMAFRRPTDAKVIHPSRQFKGSNRCGRNNGGCSHICSPSLSTGNQTFTCQCPDDMELKKDGVTCTSLMR